MNKRGQGLSTNAIVLIVLAVIVLVVLAVGFTVGFNKLAPWLSTNNVDTVVTSCSVACSTGSVYEFCSLERTLVAGDLPSGLDEEMGTCFSFSDEESLNYKEGYNKYGIGDCPALNVECLEVENSL